MMRLNKYLASCGVASRRASEKFITAGLVKINGKVVTDLSAQVNEAKDRVTVEGKPVVLTVKKVYIMLNKPKGYVTTASDERGRKTVFELLKIKERVFPIGRLDLKSEGLLLFSNDGELAHRLMHPNFKVNKVYRVRLDRPFHPDDLTPLESGVDLDGEMTAPCQVRYFMDTPDRMEIKIHEGKKNQVRRMYEALGYNVKALKRVRYGPLLLQNLDRGQMRSLTPTEIRELKKAAGMMKKK